MISIFSYVNFNGIVGSYLRSIFPLLIDEHRKILPFEAANNRKYALNRAGISNASDLSTFVDECGDVISRGTIAFVINIPRKWPGSTLDCKIDISD